MKNYYVVPDIHGMNSLLQQALTYIYDENPNGGKIIFLGDYIDRGKENIKVLDTVMNPPNNWEFVCLQGNHEQMFVDAYMSFQSFYDKKVAIEFNNGQDAPFHELHAAIPIEVVKWMNNLKLFHFEDKNVFAHAYYDDLASPEDQRDSTCLWYRLYDHEAYDNDNQGFYLTHGHTPRRHGPVQAPNRCNLDTGAVFYNRLVIAKYQKDIQGPVDFIEFVI
jgi:serine/threonine protein phosphatase 1